MLICIPHCYCLKAQEVAAAVESSSTFSSSDTAYIGGLFRRVRTYGQVSQDTAIMLMQQAMAHSLATGYTDGVAYALMQLGINYAYKGKNDTALRLIKSALPFCQRALYTKDRLFAQWYSNMSVPYAQQGHYDTALTYLIKGTDYVLSVKDTMMIIEMYIRTGVTWNLNGRYRNALYYFRKAEQVALAKGSRSALVHVYNNYAMNYHNLGDTVNELRYVQAALHLGRATNNKEEEKTALHTLALHYIDREQPDSVLYYLKLQQELHHHIPPSVRDSFDLTSGFSYAYYQLKDYRRSMSYALNALSVARGTDYIKRSISIAFYRHVAALYRELGDYRKADRYQTVYSRFSDSLNDAERNRSIDQLEAQYRSAEKDRQLMQSRLQLSERDKKIAKQNLWILSIAAGAIIIVTVLLLLYTFSRYRQSRQLTTLQQMEQQKKIEQLQALMEGQENERKRIARELHDGVASILSAAKMQLSNINKVDLSVLTASDMYQNGLGLLQEAYDEVRYTAHNLSAEKLLQKGLVAGLSDYCHRISMPDFQVHCRHFGDIPPLGNEMTIGIYRVAQELLHNIQKHAAATTVNVQTGYDGETFFLSIEDNGVGMDQQQNEHAGIGLRNIASRIAIFGGTTLDVDSRVNTGTTVYISFALKQ